MSQDSYNNFISRMLSQATSIFNENNKSNDRIKPSLTPDMLNFDARPSTEMENKNTHYQTNTVNSLRNVKNKDYNDNIDDNSDNKNSSLQETPFEKIKLRNNLNIKENKENKSHYTKDLGDKKNINDYNNDKKPFNKNDNDYDNSISNRNNYYFEREESNNVTHSDNVNEIEESPKPQADEEKKAKIVFNKDPFFDSSDGLKEIQKRERNHTQNYPKEFNYSINNNYSNYNANNKNDNQNLDTFDTDKSKYGSIRSSESYDISYSKSPTSSSSSLSSELSSSSSSSSNIKPIPSSSSLVSNSNYHFLNRSDLRSHHIMDLASSPQDFNQSTVLPNKNNISKLNVVINIDKIEIRSIDRKKVTNTKETSSKRYSQSIEEYYKKRFS